MVHGQLFSDYFLSEGIRGTDDYIGLTRSQIAELYEEFRSAFSAFPSKSLPDEADTEDGLVRPILKKLGFCFSRQKSPQRGRRQDVPDFVIFTAESDKEDFDTALRGKKPWSRVACILEGKRWGRPLDQGDKTDPIDPSVPSNRILSYLSSAESASSGRIVWAILTNGRHWRLYYHRYPSRSEGYTEFDLEEILQTGDPHLFTAAVTQEQRLEQFRLFYLLFRVEAFRATAERPHGTYLEVAVEEGRKWEERVAEDLRDKIFTDVFPELAKGFVHDARAKGEPISRDFLSRVYENTLVFLYRLLFLFYAEDRALLPIGNAAYSDYSVSRLREEIANKIDNCGSLSERAAGYYGSLMNLFEIVNLGDKDLRIPSYNGDLFRSDEHPFFQEYSIPDKFIALPIDMLGRDYGVEPKRHISYRDLSVRQLGSIYEGLLQFELKIAEAHLRVAKKKSVEVYVKENDLAHADIVRGDLYLTNDKSHRKITGSYYTPDYIVQHITKQTLKPLIYQRTEVFRGRLAKLKQSKSLRARSARWKRKYLRDVDVVEAVLNIRVLDPAAGSGHFLVNAVDYLADRILELLSEYSGKEYFRGIKYESPVATRIFKIRKRLRERAKREGFIADDKKLDDKNIVRRILLKRSLYGVDVNPLAVELAKVSLWLHTFTVGAPLSFLDHHFRCGNSLFSAQPTDLEEAFESRGSLFGSVYTGLADAIAGLQRVEDLTDADIDEIHESSTTYAEVVDSTRAYKRLLDVYVSDAFRGPQESSRLKVYQTALPLVIGFKGHPIKVIEKEVPLEDDEKRLLKEALAFAEARRFFHWKLEFPEVWHGDGAELPNGGFDAIVGNPPYDIISAKEQHRTAAEVAGEKNFYASQATFAPALGNKINYYRLFVTRALSLLRPGGLHGFIVPMGLLGDMHALSLRRFLLENIHFISIDAFPHKDDPKRRVFPEAKLPTCVYVLEKPADYQGGRRFPLRVHQYKDLHDLAPRIDLSYKDIRDLSGELLSFPVKQLCREEELGLAIRIALSHQRLSDSGVESRQGEVNTTAHKKHIVHFATRPAEMPESTQEVLRGAYVDRYLIRDPKQGGFYYLDYEKFVSSFKRSDSKAHHHKLPRIGYQRGAGLDNWRRIIAAYIPENSFCADTVNYIVNPRGFSLHFILALLNSDLFEWRFRLTSCTNHVNSYEIDSLPAPTIDFKEHDPKVLKELLRLVEKGQIARILYKLGDIPADSAILHDLISHLADQVSETKRTCLVLGLFISERTENGSANRIAALEEISRARPVPEDPVLQRELAKGLAAKLHEKAERCEELINQIVYHLYGLSDADREIIERSLAISAETE